MAWNFTRFNYPKFVLSALLVCSLFLQTSVSAQSPDPGNGPGGPVLVISSPANPFSRYTAEILRAEGINSFAVRDINTITATVLNAYDVVILGEMTVTAAQVSLFTNWVNTGGTFVAFRPDKKLAPLLGLTPASGTAADQYLKVNSGEAVTTGIVNQSIQYHGTADRYNLSGATALAFLYSNALTPTSFPAVTSKTVGTNGGKAVAFTYDLARSIVYTRQGNPAWAGQKRDGEAGPIRSDDLFFGGNDPDWIDLNKVDIPQADEQQRLLTNIIVLGSLHRKPMPRFWFLPRGSKAAIVMTGDDHAANGSEARANLYKTLGPNAPSDVAEWRAVRGSSYMWLNTPIAPETAVSLQQEGFEFALHPNTGGGCQNFTEASFESDLVSQLNHFQLQYPGVAKPSTSRTHCLVWSDWASAAKVQARNGIRLDVNYYYWPASWVQNRSGMFTGSGMPMRFADLDGSLIDCYQVVTQMTDESGINYSSFINGLLDRATGPQGYYGVFCANMHTDSAQHIGATTIIDAARSRNIPVISAKQMLTWLDGRNSSSFTNMTWSANKLSFDIVKGNGSTGLRALLPVNTITGKLTSLTAGGAAISFEKQIVKGVEYAIFDATRNGKYIATYQADVTAPVITGITATPAADNTAIITFNTDEITAGQVMYGTSPANLASVTNGTVQTDEHVITLSSLAPGVIYYFQVKATDAQGNVTTAPATPLFFTMPEGPCFSDVVTADFAAGNPSKGVVVSENEGDGGVTLRPSLYEGFDGTTVPTGFAAAKYNTTGTTIFGNGVATLDGSHIYSQSTVATGTVLDFEATFRSGTYQNIGFTIDQAFNEETWVTIGQGGVPGQLYARSSDGQSVLLGSHFMDNAHRYRIAWNSDGFDFYIDDMTVPVAKLPIVINSPLYLQISDFPAGGGTLSIDWLRRGPFTSTGDYVSRVYDAGTSKRWGTAAWAAEKPTGTNLTVSVRTGNTPSPDASWSAYVQLDADNPVVNQSARYIQYLASLSTTQPMWTPVLKNISFNCASESNVTITQDPVDYATCEGDTAHFNCTATGSATLSVQWQVSPDGDNWTDVTGATAAAIKFPVTFAANNNTQYRAAWTDGVNIVYSNPALLVVNRKPVMTSANAVTITSAENVGYEPIGTPGTQFSWSRPLTPGLANTGATGVGNINETLINTTNLPVKAIYTYTMTLNGCVNTATVTVTVNPVTCEISSAISADFNRISINSGRKIWFNAVFKPSNLGTGPVNFYVSNSKITYKLNGQTVTLAVPDAHILVAPGISPSVSFQNGMWETRIPANNPGFAFMSGLAYTVPQTIPGGAKDVTWSAFVTTDKVGTAFSWKWTAFVYSALGQHASLSIKPADDLLSILNPLVTLGNAGTVQNYFLNMVPGGMAAGLLSILGTYSDTQYESCAAGRDGLEPTTEPLITSTPNGVQQARPTETLSGNFEVKAAPNPSTNRFTLTINGNSRQPASLLVTDQTGKVVERRDKLTTNSTVTFGESFGTGIFFAEIRQGDQRKTIKLIKVR